MFRPSGIVAATAGQRMLASAMLARELGILETGAFRLG